MDPNPTSEQRERLISNAVLLSKVDFFWYPEDAAALGIVLDFTGWTDELANELGQAAIREIIEILQLPPDDDITYCYIDYAQSTWQFLYGNNIIEN